MNLTIDSVASARERASRLRQYVEEHEGEIGPSTAPVPQTLWWVECALSHPHRVDWKRISSAYEILDKTLDINRVKVPDWWLDEHWEMKAWLIQYRDGKVSEGERLPEAELEHKRRH